MMATGFYGDGAEHNGPKIRFLRSHEPDVFSQHKGDYPVPALANESEGPLIAKSIILPWYPLFLEGKVA